MTVASTGVLEAKVLSKKTPPPPPASPLIHGDIDPALTTAGVQMSVSATALPSDLFHPSGRAAVKIDHLRDFTFAFNLNDQSLAFALGSQMIGRLSCGDFNEGQLSVGWQFQLVSCLHLHNFLCLVRKSDNQFVIASADSH
jgi:hypothetical protein